MLDQALQSWPRGSVRKLSRFVLGGLAAVAGLGMTLLIIMLLGSQLHRLLTRTAGAVIGTIKDNQGVTLVVTCSCVALAWTLISLVCIVEWRRERAGGGTLPGHVGGDPPEDRDTPPASPGECSL